MKALGLVISEKIFINCILKTYFLTQWPTYATNSNSLNNLGRWTHRDHSCEVWWKSNKRYQRRKCLSKKVYARRTTHDGQRPITIAHPEHFVLRWAKTLTHDGRRTTTDDGKRPVTIAHPEHFLHTISCHVHIHTPDIEKYWLRSIDIYRETYLRM